MLGAPILDALDRIASRAADLQEAYRPGAIPVHGDVATGGSIASTTDPLSIVAPPDAWFLTRDPHGDRTFTRDGAFHFDNGVLRTRGGADVLGYPCGDARGAVPVPLRLPDSERALGRGTDARIGSDGSVTYTRVAIDPRTGARTRERVTIGTIALARFPAGSSPARIDAARFAAPAGVVPHLGTPGDGTFAAVATNSRDAGALDLDAGLERLNEAYVAFEALAAARKARGGIDKTTLDLVK